jgi:hypothetical protein
MSEPLIRLSNVERAYKTGANATYVLRRINLEIHVQVTHSETNAAYGSRTIQLFDGWITSDQKIVPAVGGGSTDVVRVAAERR